MREVIKTLTRDLPNTDDEILLRCRKPIQGEPGRFESAVARGPAKKLKALWLRYGFETVELIGPRIV